MPLPRQNLRSELSELSLWQIQCRFPPHLMISHPQDKADKSIRLPEKGVGFVTIAKGICYNDKKDLLHQDGCMGGFQVLQQKVDISGCRRWNRKNNEVVKETLHICSTIIILLPSGCEPRARKYLIEYRRILLMHIYHARVCACDRMYRFTVNSAVYMLDCAYYLL